MTRITGKNGEVYKIGNNLNFHCIGTGSKGNSGVIFSDDKEFCILVDAGLTTTAIKKVLEEHEYLITDVLLTHRHGDHEKVPTLNGLHKYNPFINFHMQKGDYEFLKTKKEFKGIADGMLHFIKHNDRFKIGNYEVIVRSGQHAVPTVGFIIRDEIDCIMYATDMVDFRFFETLDGELVLYNGMLKELNHDEAKLTSRRSYYMDKIKNAKLGESTRKYNLILTRLQGSSHHCSRFTSTKFGRTNSTDDCTIVNLHGSEEIL